MTGCRTVVAVVLAAAAASTGACRTEQPTARIDRSVRYSGAASLDVHVPRGARMAPVIVTLHGCCGDRHDLTALAHALAGEGAVVFNASWREASGPGRYPGSYQRAACAVRFARARARQYGGDPSRVTLVGWSDGGLLAAVVGNGADDHGGECDAPEGAEWPEAVVAIGGFLGWPVGDGGTVDPAYVTDETIRFFGGRPEEVPQAWSRGNAYAQLGRRPGLEFRLVVGADDELADDSRRFAEAAGRAGHPVSVAVAPGAGHQTMIAPRTAEGALAVRETLLAARGRRP